MRRAVAITLLLAGAAFAAGAGAGATTPDLAAVVARFHADNPSAPGLDEHSGDPRYAEAILADPRHAWTRDEQLRKLVAWRDPVGAPNRAPFSPPMGQAAAPTVRPYSRPGP